MKIGILTFHNAINYGAVLQCYSLQEVLRVRGHEVDVIDYRNSFVEDYAKLIPFVPMLEEKGLFNKAKFLLKNIKLYRKKCIIRKVFDSFVNNRLNLSCRISSLSDLSDKYDCIVFGSDQIWNPKICGGFDIAYYGQFPKKNIKFIVYAASIGNISDVNESEWKQIESYIGVYDQISVREIELKNAIESRFHIQVSHCIDPTLLVDPVILSKIAKQPLEDNYIFMYNVLKDDNSEGFADYIATQLGCKVIIGQSKPKIRSLRHNKNNILVESLSPEEFLGYVKKARVVIGNSFHTVAISIAFRKDFYSIESKKSERIKALLSQLDLLDRHYKSTDRRIAMSKIDYLPVYRKLPVIKDLSFQYLMQSGL